MAFTPNPADSQKNEANEKQAQLEKESNRKVEQQKTDNLKESERVQEAADKQAELNSPAAIQRQAQDMSASYRQLYQTDLKNRGSNVIIDPQISNSNDKSSEREDEKPAATSETSHVNPEGKLDTKTAEAQTAKSSDSSKSEKKTSDQASQQDTAAELSKAPDTVTEGAAFAATVAAMPTQESPKKSEEQSEQEKEARANDTPEAKARRTQNGSQKDPWDDGYAPGGKNDPGGTAPVSYNRPG